MLFLGLYQIFTLRKAMQLVQKFKKIIQIEKRRYSNKGLMNSIIAFSLLFTVFWVARQIGLFFWPSYVQDKAVFVLFGSVTLHTLTQLLSFSLYLPGYLGISRYHQKYEINKRLKWPWKRQDWPQIAKKNFFNLIIIQLWVYPVMNLCSTTAGVKLRFENFPSLLQFFTQIQILYFIQDFFAYWTHRWSHSFKFLYKLHKIHHQNDKTYTFATQYFHPIDFAFGHMLPTAMGFIILGNRVHCFTFFFWIFWKVMISNEGHSGYEFPWSPTRIIPMVSGPSYHDHHHSNNVGNFAGSCYFWDVMLGTSNAYFEDFLGKAESQ